MGIIIKFYDENERQNGHYNCYGHSNDDAKLLSIPKLAVG